MAPLSDADHIRICKVHSILGPPSPVTACPVRGLGSALTVLKRKLIGAQNSKGSQLTPTLQLLTVRQNCHPVVSFDGGPPSSRSRPEFDR